MRFRRDPRSLGLQSLGVYPSENPRQRRGAAVAAAPPQGPSPTAQLVQALDQHSPELHKKLAQSKPKQLDDPFGDFMSPRMQFCFQLARSLRYHGIVGVEIIAMADGPCGVFDALSPTLSGDS